MIEHADQQYLDVIVILRKQLPESVNEPDDMGLTLKKDWNNISLYNDQEKILLILNGTRIIVPYSARKGLMNRLHEGNAGQTKMKIKLRERYWWLNMAQEAVNKVRACSACLALQPSKCKTAHIMNAPTGLESADGKD